jgi:enamine deaminase RidA (YjgF/YER057c/UK114 family)
MADSAPSFPTPDDLAPGPGYSHVVSMPPGRMVWTSGQVAIRPDGTPASGEGLEAQARLTFENVGKALRAGGATWSDVVKLTMFLTRVDDLPTVRAVRDEFVDTSRPPTSSLVQVAGLVVPGLLIEVEAVAWTAG